MTAGVPEFVAMPKRLAKLLENVVCAPVEGSKAYNPPEPAAKSRGPNARNETVPGETFHRARVTATFCTTVAVLLCACPLAASCTDGTSVRKPPRELIDIVLSVALTLTL